MLSTFVNASFRRTAMQSVRFFSSAGSIPELMSRLCSSRITLEKGSSAEKPYCFKDSGRQFEIRVNPFPEEADTPYTLLENNKELSDLLTLPKGWKMKNEIQLQKETTFLDFEKAESFTDQRAYNKSFV